MSTVRAPTPDFMEELDGKSIISIERTDTNLILRNRAGDIVANLLVKRPDSTESKAIVRVGSQDVEWRDVLVRDWYRPGTPNIKLSSPGVVVATTSTNCVAWSPDGLYLAIGGYTASGTAYVSVWKRSGDTFSVIDLTAILPAGFIGARTVNAIVWSPDGQYLILGCEESPYIIVIQREAYTDTFEVVTPSFGGYVFSDSIYALSWSVNGEYLAMATGGGGVGKDAASILWFKVNPPTSGGGGPGGGGGTDVWIDPIISFTLLNDEPDFGKRPTSGVQDLSLSYDGTYLAAGLLSGPYLYLAKRNSLGTMWTALPGPSILPTTTVRAVEWSPDDIHLATGDGAKKIWIYERDFDAVSRVSVPDVGTNQVPDGISWSADGKYVAAAHSSTPYVSVFKFDDDGTHVRILDPNVVPAGNGRNVAFSPCGKYMAVAHAGAPYTTVYKTSNGPIQGAAVRVRK